MQLIPRHFPLIRSSVYDFVRNGLETTITAVGTEPAINDSPFRVFPTN